MTTDQKIDLLLNKLDKLEGQTKRLYDNIRKHQVTEASTRTTEASGEVIWIHTNEACSLLGIKISNHSSHSNRLTAMIHAGLLTRVNRNKDGRMFDKSEVLKVANMSADELKKALYEHQQLMKIGRR